MYQVVVFKWYMVSQLQLSLLSKDLGAGSYLAAPGFALPGDKPLFTTRLFITPDFLGATAVGKGT